MNKKYFRLILEKFAKAKKLWIGGALEDFYIGQYRATEIKDVSFERNAEKSFSFIVHGKDFDCGFDLNQGSLASENNGWVTFHRDCQGRFRIKNKFNTRGG